MSLGLADKGGIVGNVVTFQSQIVKRRRHAKSDYSQRLRGRTHTIPVNYKRANLYQQEIDDDPAEALRLANEGRSTKNRPETENRGYGISTTKRMLVEGLGGSFFMLSGSVFHRYERQSLNYYANISRFFHWNGTLILLRIPVNAPEGFNYINYLE